MNTPTDLNDPSAQLHQLSRKMIHSINNQLFIIISYCQFIEQDHRDEETLTHLRYILGASDQCQEIMKKWRTEADELIAAGSSL